MRTITGLKAQEKNAQRINVYLDGVFAFGLSRIVAAWLQIGQQLTDEKIAQLQAEDAVESAYQRTLHFLSIRPRSGKEIVQYLKKIGLNPDVQERVIERLKAHGWINDQYFASQWVENRSAFHPLSRKALRIELTQKGIEQDLIDRTILNVDEDLSAYQAAQKWLYRLRDLPYIQFQRKLYPYLARRGFSHDVIENTIQRLWTETQTEKQNPEEIEVSK